jgi:hypothetical protein
MVSAADPHGDIPFGERDRRLLPEAEELVDQNIASWNRIGEWLRQIDQLRVLGKGCAC